MLREFTANNTCEQCYISTRANTEKSLGDFLSDNWEMLVRQIFGRERPAVAPSGEAPEIPPAAKPAPDRQRQRSAAAQ